jgi:hypothetical protein
MEKLRILPFIKLFALVLALASYNLVPDLSQFAPERHADSSYAQFHSSQEAYFQIQENVQLKKEFSNKTIFSFHGDEACLSESLATPFATPQLNQVSSFTFHSSISPRAPPLS